MKKHPALLSGPSIFAGVMCLAVFILLTVHLISQYRFIRTNDALVQAHFTPLSAKVPGRIAQVWVRDHETVSKGQLLAIIEEDPYQAQLTLATAEQSASRIAFVLAQKDYARASLLHAENSISQQALDQAKTTFEKAQQNWVNEKAQTESAQIQYDYTHITAPADGIVASVSAVAGMEVRPGTPLLGLVYPQTKWIIAKVKETDLADLKVGEAAEVRVDAIPNRTFAGKIASISPATEGVQGALPPDNAAGNFTKYIQRVPVKIALNLSAEDQVQIRAGLSADVTFRRSHE